MRGQKQVVVDYTAARKAWRATLPSVAEPQQPKRKRANTCLEPRKTVNNYVENPELGIPQSEMSRLCPPGCSVWRDNVRGAWSVHLPPWKRFSRPFWVFGEQGAGLEAMREAWRLYLRDNGMDFSECPMESFFHPGI